MLALLVSDIANPFYPQLAKAVERQAVQEGYGVVICNTADDPELAARHVQRLLDQGIDGILHASVGLDEEPIADLAVVDVPVVFVNRRPAAARASFVVSDNRAAGRSIGLHLLDLGRTSIGFVSGPDFARNGQERLEGLQAAVREHRRTGRVIVKPGDFSRESGAAAVREWIAANELPGAIVGVNDSVAIGVMETLRESGRSVPEDVAVAGFDDIDLASSSLISLTSVAQDIERMGTRAVRVLLRLGAEKAKTHSRPIREVLPSRLIVRRSTRSGDADHSEDAVA